MIRLGLPSKGRLMDETLSWFAARGVTIRRDGADRTYAATTDLPGVEVVLTSAAEIARDLATGRLTHGVTGTDLIHDKVPDWSGRLTCLAGMGFGQADLVIAVPAFWADCRTLDDLDRVAAAFRRRHGFRLRIATKYHRLVREHLSRAGVADYQLIDSLGATEGTVAAEAAEAVADITSTGETLRANGLRVLDDGLILQSQACLWQSRVVNPEESAAFAAILARHDAGPRAPSTPSLPLV
jgi:ATP phosphoribosyltransferase